MDRRKSLKIIGLGSLSSAVLFDACKLPDKKKADAAATLAGSGNTPAAGPDRQPEEIAHYNKVVSAKFFTEHEMATIAILSDIIIPKDDVSGSATDAGVPDFIEFIVKDMPGYQVPMRGGLRWIDRQCYQRFGKNFKDSDQAQRIQVVDDIAWPKKAKPEMSQGVSFFTLMRNLTCTGFYTSKIGIEDIGYKGNQPNQWNGVPDDVLKQYGLAYTEKELKECISFS
ncbi:gluconate 2-dehydrogenase subunit 3 family protein [Agriterribacter sp.]|uniref:gluconate 2-dehydrogenase subunit 3 family protein n=1 Tax=Agriterribacter sp. TaxID=2821509 RepID=UPI002C959A2C|nr:gluconate 2-dehydrogenase subunit 3 family protein [Agriterribacter sp.]HTN09052.1 gluconate 2-dehydrogenase subunit 3 family protein [Agriterribacter sp.]